MINYLFLKNLNFDLAQGFIFVRVVAYYQKILKLTFQEGILLTV